MVLGDLWHGAAWAGINPSSRLLSSGQLVTSSRGISGLPGVTLGELGNQCAGNIVNCELRVFSMGAVLHRKRQRRVNAMAVCVCL